MANNKVLFTGIGLIIISLVSGFKFMKTEVEQRKFERLENEIKSLKRE